MIVCNHSYNFLYNIQYYIIEIFFIIFTMFFVTKKMKYFKFVSDILVGSI